MKKQTKIEWTEQDLKALREQCFLEGLAILPAQTRAKVILALLETSNMLDFRSLFQEERLAYYWNSSFERKRKSDTDSLSDMKKMVTEIRDHLLRPVQKENAELPKPQPLSRNGKIFVPGRIEKVCDGKTYFCASGGAIWPGRTFGPCRRWTAIEYVPKEKTAIEFINEMIGNAQLVEGPFAAGNPGCPADSDGDGVCQICFGQGGCPNKNKES